jgi:hypothetical protein
VLLWFRALGRSSSRPAQPRVEPIESASLEAVAQKPRLRQVASH